jgi:hypothetical protein
MKKDTLFEHKEIIITYEWSMGDVNEYQKLLEHQPSMRRLVIEVKQMWHMVNAIN